MRGSESRAPFHIMAKPIGPICNLDCKYCFYLEKENLYPDTHNFRMTDAVLESYVRQYIEAHPHILPNGDVPEINFAWQGGEPTLLGVDFFRKVVALQSRYANGKRIANSFQTNGILLNDEWCAFFKEHQFLIGLSIDGPRELHDVYRVDKGQRPTFDRVMRGLEFLKKHAVEFNTLTVVHCMNSQRPLRVYRFLKEIGSTFIQFIPLVERVPDAKAEGAGLTLDEPPTLDAREPSLPVTDWSVESRQYGNFLSDIFDEWVRQDVGRIFVQMFDVALGNWMKLGSGLCIFAETCGRALALEHNGDVYACDHYVYPWYRLGNLASRARLEMNQSLGDMVDSPEQAAFGNDKSDTLPEYCRKCEVRFACNGGCPKHRFIRTPDGDPGLNYLCAGYQRFFNHVDLYMRTMEQLLNANRAPAEIMSLLVELERRLSGPSVGRNDPCPCGSGRKYKKCCM